MPVLALIFVPAVWCGWLVATVAVWLLGWTLPLWGMLLPANFGSVPTGLFLALVGAGVAVVGNVLLLVDFDRTKARWWIDNALVLAGAMAWLAGGLLVGEAWWRQFDGRLVAALLLAPQMAALFAGLKAADDSGLTTMMKLLGVGALLGVLQWAVVVWLPL